MIRRCTKHHELYIGDELSPRPPCSMDCDWLLAIAECVLARDLNRGDVIVGTIRDGGFPDPIHVREIKAYYDVVYVDGVDNRRTIFRRDTCLHVVQGPGWVGLSNKIANGTINGAEVTIIQPGNAATCIEPVIYKGPQPTAHPNCRPGCPRCKDLAITTAHVRAQLERTFERRASWQRAIGYAVRLSTPPPVDDFDLLPDA